MADKRQTTDTAPEAWGRLKILEHLASGISSEVFRARDTVLDREVALKLFNSGDENEQQGLLEDGRALARIRHPNVVQIMGADIHDGRVGFWMELFEAQTLESLLEEQGPMSVADAIAVGRQLCAAIATIHNSGLLYRDIKLRNVIRASDSGIRLLGFGGDIDEDSIAPELRAGRPPSRRSDIYALGVLLKRLIAGTPARPEKGFDPLQQLEACIETAMAEDPGDRYPTAEKFARALVQAGKRPPNRARRIAGIGLILLLAVLVIQQWPAQYRFDNALYRINADDSRTELVDGAAIAGGDSLVLEVSTTIPMYVYVFAEDTVGNAWGLFPLAAAGHANPLRADETHTLPAEGDDAVTWVVDDRLRIDRVHILACPEAVPEFDALYAELQPLDRPDLPGHPAAPLIEAARMLDEEAEIAIGVTYRSIELNAP